MGWWTTGGVVCALVCVPGAAVGQSDQFRGGPQHTGVVNTEGVKDFGGVAWRFKTGGTVRSSAALSNGTLYIGASDGRLYALAAGSGRLEWSYDAGAPIASSPAISDGMVLIGSRDGVLHGVSASSGQGVWKHETGADLPLAWGREGWDYILSSPTIWDGTAFWGSGDGHVYAVDPETGTLRWSFQTGGRVRSTPAVADGLLVVGNSNGFIYALDASSGEEQWRFETAGVSLVSENFGYDRKQISASPSIVDGVVYIGSRDASLYALDARDGTELWSLGESSAWIISSSAVTDEHVVSARSSSGNLRSIDRATGEEEWAVATGALVFSSPVVAGSVVYVGQGAGLFAAYDLETGDVRWSYQTGAGIFSTPLVHDGRVYVGSDDRYVYAFQGTDGPPVKRAVFFDDALTERSVFGSRAGHSGARDYFVRRGYEALDSPSLLDFLQARISDEVPSVVVFAMDALPPGAGSGSGSVSLMRRYLDSGGKVVWMGYLPEYLVRDEETGSVTATDALRPGALLSVDFTEYWGDTYGVTPTDAGRSWGLTTSWVGQGTTVGSEVSEVLATDELGRAVAWVKGYGGPTGTGFVFVRTTTSSTILAELQRVAEYGLLGERARH